MLVEINLLPQKEPKKLGLMISLASLIVVFLLVGVFYLWQINTTKSEVVSLDRKIAMTKKIAEKAEIDSQVVASSSSVNQLKSAIEWVNEYPIQTIPVMNQLTSLLPERAFIQSFGYAEDGTITISVQFDSSKEAAYFLAHLHESKWIAEASLSSLTAAETKKETSTNTATINNSQTNETTNQTNTYTSSKTTANEKSTDPIAKTGTKTKTAKGNVDKNSSSKTNSNKKLTTSKSATAKTKTASNAKNAATTSSKNTKKDVSKNILPRYTGQFEVKLNKEYVKEQIKKSKKNEKGVAGS